MGRPRKTQNMAWIADEAGVSVATVSNVLNNRAGVGEGTRRKIERIVSSSIYTRSYRNVKPRTLTALASNLSSWYMSDALSGAIQYCLDANLNVNTVTCVPGEGMSLLAKLRQSHCDGIIVMALGLGAEDIQLLKKSGKPIVLVDDMSSDPEIGYVNNDSFQGSYDLARHLLSLGHRRIGYISYREGEPKNPRMQNTDARIKGWRKALLEAGVPEKELAGLFRTSLHSEMEEAVKRLVSNERGATAAMVVDDHMALAAMQACGKLGLRIPQELSVTGFDDIFDAQYFQPALTTARHSACEMAQLAAKSLCDLLSGKTCKLPRTLVPARLSIRESTGPVKTIKTESAQ